MENRPTAIGSLFESAGSYLETRIDLLKLKTVDKSSEVVSSLVSSLIILLIIAFGIFILNIGLSIWLGHVMGQMWYGFFAVGGFYTALAIVLTIFKSKWLKGPLNDIIVKKLIN
jgi:uncharacterized membrane protein YidH (DUF202 family)